MLQDSYLGKNYRSRGHSFALLGMAAFHRGLRVRLLDEARRYHNIPNLHAQSMQEADRHSREARSWVNRSRRFGLRVVLP